MADLRSLNMDLTLPEEFCGLCRNEVPDEEQFEIVGAINEHTMVAVTICRACLGEHVPEALEAIEEDE